MLGLWCSCVLSGNDLSQLHVREVRLTYSLEVGRQVSGFTCNVTNLQITRFVLEILHLMDFVAQMLILTPSSIK